MRREFPVGPHDDGRLLEPQGRDPVHHRRDPQARGFPPGTLSWGSLPLGSPCHPWALSTSRLGGRLNAGHPEGDPQSTGRKVKDDDGCPRVLYAQWVIRDREPQELGNRKICSLSAHWSLFP